MLLFNTSSIKAGESLNIFLPILTQWETHLTSLLVKCYIKGLGLNGKHMKIAVSVKMLVQGKVYFYCLNKSELISKTIIHF